MAAQRRSRLTPKPIGGSQFFADPAQGADQPDEAPTAGHLSVAPSPGPAPAQQPARQADPDPAAQPPAATLAPVTAPLDSDLAPPTAPPASPPASREDPARPQAGGQDLEADADDELAEARRRPHQASFLVSPDVRSRFSAYKKRTGLPNTQILFDALNGCRDRYQSIVDSSQPAPDPDLLFGSERVPGRRTTTQAQSGTQLSFRVSETEHTNIEKLAERHGALSMSAFVNAVLDTWLPKRRRPGTQPPQPHAGPSPDRATTDGSDIAHQ